MRARINIILSLMMLTTALSAQPLHRVGFGMSAGAGTLFGDSTLTNRWGPTVGIEGYYACLFQLGKSDVWLGPRTGLDVSWLMSGWSQEAGERFTNKDYLGYDVDYTVTAQIKETHHQLALSVPLMAALRYKGFVAGAGIKAQAVVWNTCQTELSDLDVTAYYPKLDVSFHNEPFLGTLSQENTSVSGARNTPEWHIAAAVEAGYEWELNDNRFLGIRLFADYDVWNSFTHEAGTLDRAVVIEPIQAASQPAKTSLVPLCESVVTRFSALRVGVTFSYTFDIQGDTRHYGCNCLKY